MGYEILETISGLPPDQQLDALIEKVEDLKIYIKRGHLQPEFLPLFYEILASISPSTETTFAHMFLALATVDFYNVTKEFIMNLPLVEDAKKVDNNRFWADPNCFFLNVSKTLNTLIGELPNTAVDHLPSVVKYILYTLTNIENRHGIIFDSGVKQAYEDIRMRLDKIVAQYQLEKEDRHKESAVPPEAFRDIDVYPSAWEINSDTRIFLRKNLIKGKYDSVDDYLDVQFRLIREDFVAPLRNDLCAYLAGTPEKSLNIKVHKNVRVYGVKLHNRETGYFIRIFRSDAIPSGDLSERFMNGALLCLSQDNFQTVCFGRVLALAPKEQKDLLRCGCLLLSIPNEEYLQINASYTVIECSVYFEPYYHVMNAIQSTHNVPMSKYFVDVSTDIDDCDSFYRQLPLEEWDDFGLNYLYNYEIPSYQNLNESQRAAYDAAMTKEFCLIQGPPGTGKTYLGLQIARELLLRREGPIFVVCFTNHALDQFLEGLLDTTYDIIRVGGQSKCEALEDFNYQKLKDYRYLHKYYDEEFQVLNFKLKREAALISMLCQYNHIVDINWLSRDYLTCFGKNFKQSWFNRASGWAILDWLCCKSNTRVNVQQPQEGSWRRRAQNNYMENYMENYMDNYMEIDFMVSLKNMEQEIFNLRHHLRSLEYKRKHDTLNYLNELKRYQNLQSDYDYIREQLNMLRDLKTNPSVSEINVNYDDPSKMPSRDRWLLYGAWVNDLKEYILNHYQERKIEFDQIKRKMDTEGEWVNADILSKAKVIGMTTTCAAKMHRVIGNLFCPIVIVEEAAEVLEAHVIISLTASCKKLILIGDHQQLKPSTADYQITTKYKLGVSLFERMVNNGVPCYTLTEQRRMRPEIAALISPSIYPILTNGREVEAYPTVRGMTKSLFFITHQNREEVTGTTRRNPFEAQYLILLARHLVLNGYDPMRITMLAAYSGQMHEMQRRQRDHRLLDSMRICVLDNFQGEENDIILLSLVRNNADGINGFLNLENRVCVALSRARHGLFIMGNIAQLCNGNTIWPKVAAVLYEQDAIGEYLTSHCVNHPSTATQVCNITDFNMMPKGGCTVPCKMVLDCGHICKDVCHACNHDEYCCTEPCTRVLCEMGHICPRRCYNDCGDCLVPRECDLSCGHTGDVPCYQTPDDYLCPINVAVKLDCGHENIKKCHEDEDEMVCLHPCVDLLPCGHSCPKLCHPFSDEIHRNMNCRRDCSKSNVLCKVENGEKHRCKKKCFEHCEICEIAVQRKRKCGHIHEVQCSDDINQVPCNILYEKELSCGHRCMLPCSMKYESTECKTLVSLEVELPCGHQDLKVPCYLKITNDLNKELLDFCAKLCTSVLKCGHLCKGTCGKCAQGRFHVGCQIESCKIEHSMPVRYSSSYMFFLQTLRKYQKDNISLAILKEFKSGIKYNTTNKELRLHSSFCIVKDILEVCSAFKTRDFIKLDNKTKDYLLFLINKCCVMVSMSKQNYDDFKTELDRLKRIVEMDCLRNKYHKVEQDSEFIICQESLFQITKYNQTQDDIIKEHLDRLSKRFNSEPI